MKVKDSWPLGITLILPFPVRPQSLVLASALPLLRIVLQIQFVLELTPTTREISITSTR